MSKVRRKSTTCLNCKKELRPEDNYCPNCGQENNTLKIPVKHLVFEIFEDFFHFDAKIWNTIKASFSKPGRITIDYLEGKRVSYVPPVKFYVFVSFIFFLLLGKLSEHSIEQGNSSFIQTKEEKTSMKITLNELLGHKKIYYSKDTNDLRQISFRFNSKDSLYNELQRLKTAPDSEIDKLLLSEDIDTTNENRGNLRKELSLIPEHTLALDTAKASYEVYGKVKFATKEEYDDFKQKIRSYNNKQIDSVLISKGEEATWFNRQMLKKLIRLEGNDIDNTKQMSHAIIQSISITMFIMMPLTAILLLLIFYRKKYYYEHLIFSIHIHTIFFIIFSFVLVIQVFISDKFGGKLWSWSLLLCLIYLIISLKNNYQQSWGKTISKFILMSIPYLIISLTLTIFAVLYGFLA